MTAGISSAKSKTENRGHFRPSHAGVILPGRHYPQVFVVDDDPEIRIELEEFLDDLPGTVTAVENGATLLRQVKETRASSIVLLDLSIPGENVCETISALAALG